MIKTQAVARLKETARFDKNSKLWVNNFVKELKKSGVRFDKKDIKIDSISSYVRLGTGFKRNLADPVEMLLEEMHPKAFKMSKFKTGGFYPYCVFTLLSSDEGLPSNIDVNVDFGDIYIQF